MAAPGRFPSPLPRGAGRLAPLRAEHPAAHQTLLAGSLANEAEVYVSDGRLELHGDPTESALLIAGARLGVTSTQARATWRPLAEVPFEPELQYSVSIQAAIEEGRVTFDNLRKVTFFLVSTGAGAIVTLLGSLALGWPLPFVPAQLLWLNLVTNGLQDVALAFEPRDEDVSSRPPRRREEGFISGVLWERTALAGLVMGVGTMVAFRWQLDRTGSLVAAQTTALTTMVLFQVFQVGNARSEYASAFAKSPLSNPFLFFATAAALTVHVGALFFPGTQFVLRVQPITDLTTWGWILGTAATLLVAMELHKLWRRPRPAAPSAARDAPRRPLPDAG